MDLLPPEEKQSLEAERRRRFFVVLALFLGAIFLAGVILMFPSFLFLTVQKKDLLRELAITQKAPLLKEVDAVEEEIKNLNLRLALYEKSSKEIRPTAAVLEKVFKTRPPTIRLNYFSYESASQTNPQRLVLRGRATSRSELLKFVSALEKLEEFQKVYSPLSNLLQENNVDFSLTLEIKS